MNRAAYVRRLLSEEQDQSSSIVPDNYQVDLERRHMAASNVVKIFYRDYMYHLRNLKDAIARKVNYPEQMNKFQIQRHAKEEYEHALKVLRQIPYREFAQHGM